MTFLLLLVLPLAASVGALDIECESPYEQVGNECYYFSIVGGVTYNFDMARSDCQMLNGDLALLQQDCVQDQHLVDYIITQGWTTSSMFVGVSDQAQENMWMWIDGRMSDMFDSLWRYSEPDMGSSNDCGVLDYYNYDFPRVHLIDASCSTSLYYICQYGAHSKK